MHLTKRAFPAPDPSVKQPLVVRSPKLHPEPGSGAACVYRPASGFGALTREISAKAALDVVTRDSFVTLVLHGLRAPIAVNRVHSYWERERKCHCRGVLASLTAMSVALDSRSMNDALVADVAGLLEQRGPALVFSRPPDVLGALRATANRSERVAVVGALAAFGHFLATKKSSPDAARTLMTQLESALRTMGDIK